MTIALAGCVLRNSEGGILLIHRETESYNHWEIPGGKIEPNETAHTAAIRELQEELGLQVQIERELGRDSFTDNDRQFSYVWWLATTTDKPRITESYLFSEWRYIDMHVLLAGGISLSEGAKAFIGLVKSGKVTL